MRAVFNLPALILLAAPLAAQDNEWVEVRFYRVHLKNGNFIDGQLTSQSNYQVILQLKAGEMAVRRDLIDRVEFVKIRSLNEKPKPIETKTVRNRPVLNDSDPAEEKEPEGAAGRAANPDPPPKEGATKPSTPKDKVQQVLEKFRTVKPDGKYELVSELMKTEGATAEYLAKLIASSDPEMRYHISELLLIMKDKEAVPTLKGHLASRDPGLRAMSIELIGQLGDVESAGEIRPFLKDKDSAVRIAAIVALQTFGDRGAFEAIAELTLDKEQGVRNRSINAVFDIARKHDLMPEAVQALSTALDRARGEARSDLIRGIGRSTQKAAWRSLSPYLSDSDSRVRASAAEALGQLGSPESRDAVLNQLSSESDKRARISLGVAAARLKILDAIPILITWLAENDADLNTAAQQHLRTLSGQNFGADQSKWTGWWNQVKPK